MTSPPRRVRLTSSRHREKPHTAVVTLVSGRHQHLRAQRSALAASVPAPDLHIVVAMDDPEVDTVLQEQPSLATIRIDVVVPPDGLPLAAARNAGAAAALEAGAELIVMLDVDCLPGPSLIARYRSAADGPGSQGLLAGPVTYLPPTPAGGWTPEAMAAAGSPHAARPVPGDGVVTPAEHRLFWSLSFALRASTWRRIGGFHPRYVGYGAEDTDYSMTAQAAHVPMYWVGGADAFHQHHPISRPPVEHLDAILRNGRIFWQRWGWWPMEGWMDEFERLGLVQRDGEEWTRRPAIRLASVPALHPYVDAVKPRSAQRVRPDRQHGWAPDPLLDCEYLRSVAAQLDLVHVHFGYDHLELERLEEWLTIIRARRIPLVLTVHDLRNPHHDDPATHAAQLALLTAAADEVITLTEDAAKEVALRYGRQARVLSHPTLLESRAFEVTEPGLVVMALKSLRRNLVTPDELILAAGRGAVLAGGRLQATLHSDVAQGPGFDRIADAAKAAEATLSIHERLSDDQLVTQLGRAHACVLPYQFGTHSGLLELCRDLGTHVIAPSCGYYGGSGGQWEATISYTNDERAGFEPQTLISAVQQALGRPAAPPADRTERTAQREQTRAAHELLYRELLQL